MKKLVDQVIEDQSFEGQDLREMEIAKCIFRRCNFDNANMAEVQATGTSFLMCSFVGTNMRDTNCKDSVFSGSVFDPGDAYGMTVTIRCKLWENVTFGQLWWYMWLMILCAALPQAIPVRADLKQLLIGFIGTDRYLKLKTMMAQRNY